MPESTPSFAPEILLENQSMLRRLARALVSADHVDDVVQDTWLAFLRRPPRAAGAVGAWLASVIRSRAVDAQRRGARRIEREHAVAREEAVEPVDRAVQRATVQRDVVEAVLALREPYRSVVLLTYFDALSPARIGVKLGRSSATVRSQLHRAHALLRETLDLRYGGKRNEWCVALLPLAEASGWLVVGAAGLATVALGVVIARAVAPAHELAPPVLPPIAAAARAPADGAAQSPPEAAPANERVALQEPPRASTTSTVDIEKLSARELLELAVQAKRVVAARVLVPEERFFTEQAALLAMPDTGIARLLRGGGEPDLSHAVLARGGGTYYSFATKSHSYDDEPDLSFRNGFFSAGFYGGQVGLIVELGDVSLDSLPLEPGPPPAIPIEPRARDSWDRLWTDFSAPDAAQESWRTDQALRRPLGASKPGTAYLLRSHSSDEHSHLVAFRVLDLDGRGCTIAWRILKRWPLAEGNGGHTSGAGELLEPTGSPAWLEALTLDGLVALLDKVRGRARVLLLEVPKDLTEQYQALTKIGARSFADQTGFARILPNSDWGPVLDLREGGRHYSFRTHSNDYDDDPDLGFDQKRFGSGFAGRDKGFLVDLGVFPFEQLAAVMNGELPDSTGAREREAFELLRTMRPWIADGKRALPENTSQRLAELGVDDSVLAQLGHTYALRTALLASHDHLVVFTVIADDGAGLSLAWRVIESWPVVPEPRNR